jgi:hypothetical protein
MDLMRARVALRERPLLDVLDLSIRFCTAHAGSYAKLSLAVLVPAFAVTWAAGQLAGPWMAWLSTLALTAFAGAPFVALASRLVFADEVGTGEALRIGLRAVPGLMVIRLLQMMALAASTITLGLAWLWLGPVMLFVVEVLILEQGGVGGTLGRAQRVANAHFSDAALMMFLSLLGPICAAMLADWAGRDVLQQVLEVKPPPSMFRDGWSVLALAGWWSVQPLLQTARFFVYLDIRTRTEGWDIQTRFAAIAARADAERQEQAVVAASQAARRRAATASVAAGAALLLALMAVTAPAHAASLDPDRAQADVDAAMHDGDYPFCSDPREPLSWRARDLCPHASEIPGCAGFEAACTKVTAPPKPPPSWLFRWLNWLPHSLSLPSFLGTLLQVLVWVLVAGLVLAILLPVIRAIARARREKADDEVEKTRPDAKAEERPVELPMTTDEEALLARANELARSGQYAPALQLYLAASLRALDKRGAVRIARDRTNGEYVRACGDAVAKPALRDIVGEVDRVQFGGQEASADGVTRAAQRALAIVRAAPALLMALSLVFLLGCGGGSKVKLPRKGDDPAGGELFRDVLRRQGFEAKPLASALASLPLPKAGERTAAVVVDLERTDLDDDTRDHLVEWVDAGGVLVLAGNPYEWPKPFGATGAVSTGLHRVKARRLVSRGADEDEEDAASEPVYGKTLQHGEVVSGAALGFSAATDRAAWFDDEMTYAAVLSHGRGFVLGIASDELMTNAGLARPGNAAVMVAILSNAGRTELRLADAEDGVSPPSTPIAALLRAGLGTGLAHAIAASIVLFLAVGVRMSRPRPAPPPRRRAFAEHVEAVGALYARTRDASHALTAYARFADERLRARMPRGTGDVAAFLSMRARVPLDTCRQLWTRAVQAKGGAPPLGDELAVLRDLTSVYSAAMQDKG